MRKMTSFIIPLLLLAGCIGYLLDVGPTQFPYIALTIAALCSVPALLFVGRHAPALIPTSILASGKHSTRSLLLKVPWYAASVRPLNKLIKLFGFYFGATAWFLSGELRLILLKVGWHASWHTLITTAYRYIKTVQLHTGYSALFGAHVPARLCSSMTTTYYA